MICDECQDLMQLKHTCEGDYWICISCNHVNLIFLNENKVEDKEIDNND